MQRFVWNPIFLKLDQPLAAFHHLVDVKSWDSEVNVRLVHASKVLVASEHDNSVVDGAVSF